MFAAKTQTNPFPGLRPFEAEENHLFFGREGQTDEILRRLRQTRFLAVVGVSGSGKSSLVKAGLLPSLHSGFMTQAGSHWRVALFRPGDNPIGNLANALAHPDVLGKQFDTTASPSSQTSDSETSSDPSAALATPLLIEIILRRGSLGLVEAIKQAWLPQYENLLVVVDQFEELFRFKQSTRHNTAGDEASAFVKLLLAAARQPGAPIYIVLTMRSDFFGDCAQFRDLPEALNDSQYLVPRLTRDQRRNAITRPVAVGGAQITPRLVNRLLNDMGDDPDQLPILQHALMRTWDYWANHCESSEPIDLRHYDAIGGMAQALSQHADEIYDRLPDHRCREIAEKLFKCLTDKGLDNREVRRPSKLSEVCAVAATKPDEAIAIVERFRGSGKSFLMPPAGVELTEETVLDISHESLMRVWRRLKDWVDQEAQSAQIYRRLAETAVMHQQEKAGFLRDPELTIGLNWRRETQPNAAWAKRYTPIFEPTMQFLEASAVARDREIAEHEATRRRRFRQLWSLITGLAVLALLAIGAAVFAFQQRQATEEQRQLALQRSEEAEEQRQEAEKQKTVADRRREEADGQRRLAEQREEEAKVAKDQAVQQEKQTEAARKSEAEQRMRAEAALQRAEQGEAEALKQQDIAEKQAINSDILAQSLAAENLLASNLELVVCQI